MIYDDIDDQHPDFDIVCEACEVMAYWYRGDWQYDEDDELDRLQELTFQCHVEDIRKRGVSSERIKHETGLVLARLDADGAGAHAMRIRRQAEELYAAERYADLPTPPADTGDPIFDACWTAAATGKACPAVKGVLALLPAAADRLETDQDDVEQHEEAVAAAEYNLAEMESYSPLSIHPHELIKARAELYVARCELALAERQWKRRKLRKGIGPKTRRTILPGGYVKTGKYKKVDGVRVPILRKI
jgi:hypothetical protein